MKMTRITITLPQSLGRRLEVTAKNKGISVSKLARELMQTQLHLDSVQGRERSYQVLQKMIGKAKSKITDASTTIDEVLYGGEQFETDNDD